MPREMGRRFAICRAGSAGEPAWVYRCGTRPPARAAGRGRAAVTMPSRLEVPVGSSNLRRPRAEQIIANESNPETMPCSFRRTQKVTAAPDRRTITAAEADAGCSLPSVMVSSCVVRVNAPLRWPRPATRFGCRGRPVARPGSRWRPGIALLPVAVAASRFGPAPGVVGRAV